MGRVLPIQTFVGSPFVVELDNNSGVEYHAYKRKQMSTLIPDQKEQNSQYSRTYESHYPSHESFRKWIRSNAIAPSLVLSHDTDNRESKRRHSAEKSGLYVSLIAWPWVVLARRFPTTTLHWKMRICRIQTTEMRMQLRMCISPGPDLWNATA